MALPHGAMGWSAVCDVVVPNRTHLLFSAVFTHMRKFYLTNLYQPVGRIQTKQPHPSDVLNTVNIHFCVLMNCWLTHIAD